MCIDMYRKAQRVGEVNTVSGLPTNDGDGATPSMRSNSTEQILLDGHCRCGRAVTKILNSEKPTIRRDGIRYIYPGEVDTGWCIFRCRSCESVIEESWEAGL